MKQKKFLFLDVDGVLNCMLYCDRTGKELNPENIRRLKQIVDATGTMIVLSSTWKRIWDSEDEECKRMKQRLLSALREYSLSISTCTPNLKSGNRPQEIDVFLSAYRKAHSDEILYYAILDDDYKPEDYEPYGLERHLISTKYFCNEEEGGIQDSHVLKAIKLLGK